MGRPTFNQIAEFMCEMRGTGHYADQLILKRGSGKVYDKNQFVIACEVSGKEIKTGDFTVLEEFCDHVDSLRKINCRAGYLHYGRVTVLMNELHNHYNKHGEARLLDQDDVIRESLGIEVEEEFEEHKDYLGEMNDVFEEVHGYGTKPYLLIFSHYIPCTIDGHMCAEVIGEFAAGSSYKVFVGYEDVYKKTNRKDAIKAMRGNGVGVITPSQL